MRRAISSIAWHREEESDAAALIKSLGLDAVEIAPTRLWSDLSQVSQREALNYRYFWESFQLEIVALQALLFGQTELNIFAAPAVRAATMDYLKKAVLIGSWLGARILVFGSPKNRLRGPLSVADANAIARSFFAELGDWAHQHRVSIGIEANPPEYGCDFVTSTQEAASLVAEVASAGFSLHMDLGAALLDNFSHLALAERQRLIRSARHFHCSLPFLAAIHPAAAEGLRGLLQMINREERDPEACMSIEMRAASASNLQAIEIALTYCKPC